MEEIVDREALPRATRQFRVTDQLSADELSMWNEAEQEYVCRVKAASHRRDKGINPYTEDQLTNTVQLLDRLRSAKMQPDQCRGDLSGSAPAIIIDGDLPNSQDADRRTDDEYRAQIAAARPRCETMQMLSANLVRRYTATPMNTLCLTGVPAVVLNALSAVDSRLRVLRLSQTPHESRRAFQDASGLVLYVKSSNDGGSCCHLFGVYGDYGVTCVARETDWVLEAYAFTGKNTSMR